MKIIDTKISFTGTINIGKLALFIRMDEDGTYIDMDELVNRAVHFNTIVLYGKPYEQKEELPKFIRKCKKFNNDIIIEIHSIGNIKPVGINNFDNVKQYVNLQLKNSGIEYKDRIVDGSVKWFIDYNSYFIFNIENEDDVDEVEMIIQNYSIEKRHIYLTVKGETTSEQLDMLIKYARQMGYNFTIDLKELFWKDYGSDKDE